MSNDNKDNIMRELFCRRKDGFLDPSGISGVNNYNELMDAIKELKIHGFLITDVSGWLKITKLGENFCTSSSFCCSSKPIIVE